MSETDFSIKTFDHKYKGLEKEKESEWTSPFFFIQSADTQLGLIERYIEKLPNPQWQKEIILTQKAIDAANKMVPKPKFFVICGDLVDAFPGTELRDPQVNDLKKCFKQLKSDIPLVCVCGNHDIGDTPTKEAIEKYRNTFGDDYFTFWCSGVLFIVLNSQYYEDPSLVMELAREHDSWIDDVLRDAKHANCKHIIVFQHIPWFLFEFNEEKEYFNMEKEIREKMLKKFHDAGVRAIFCGHYHRNAGGMYKDLEVIVTSAIGAQLGNEKSGFRIVKVFEDSIRHKYYGLDDVPINIDLNEHSL